MKYLVLTERYGPDQGWTVREVESSRLAINAVKSRFKGEQRRVAISIDLDELPPKEELDEVLRRNGRVLAIG